MHKKPRELNRSSQSIPIPKRHNSLVLKVKKMRQHQNLIKAYLMYYINRSILIEISILNTSEWNGKKYSVITYLCKFLILFSSRKQELLKYFSIFFLSSFFLLPTLVKCCQYVIYTYIQVLLIIFLIISDYFFLFFFIFSDFF